MPTQTPAGENPNENRLIAMIADRSSNRGHSINRATRLNRVNTTKTKVPRRSHANCRLFAVYNILNSGPLIMYWAKRQRRLACTDLSSIPRQNRVLWHVNAPPLYRLPSPANEAGPVDGSVSRLGICSASAERSGKGQSLEH